MKSTVWKLTALAGVMGAGFLVVYQAQTNLAGKPQSNARTEDQEQFNPPDDSLSDADADGIVSSVDGDPADEVEGAAAHSGEQDPGAASEPTLAWESISDEEEYDPFAERSDDQPEPEPTMAESAESEKPSPGPQRSRFADLVASITDAEKVADETATAENDRSTSEGQPGLASFARAAEPPIEASDSEVSDSGDAGNLFAFGEEGAAAPPQTEPTAEPTLADVDSLSPPDPEAPAPVAETPAKPRNAPLDFADASPETESSPIDITDDDSADEIDPFAVETAATRPDEPSDDQPVPLPAGDDGPSLSAPPFDVASDEPAPELAPPEDNELGKAPNQQEVAALGNDNPFAIEQTSGEDSQDSAAAEELNPFPVLPGETEPAPAPKSTASSPPKQRGFAFADLPPAHNSPAENPPPQAQTRGEILPFGESSESESVSEPAENTDPFSSQADAAPANQPKESEIDPFGGAPTLTPPDQPEKEVSPAPESPAVPQQPALPGPDRRQPAPFSFGANTEPQLPPSRPSPDLTRPSPPAESRIEPPPNAPPNFPTVGPPQTRPAPREEQPQLTSDDFVGSGTIEKDSPLGPQQAQVTIEKQAPPNAVIGSPLVYSIHVRNVGGSVAENVVVKDVTPKGSRLVGTSPQAELDEVNNTLIWRLGRMESGELRTIKIKVVPTHPGSIGSVATVSFEAVVAARTVITAPQLKLGIQGPNEVGVGEKVTYRFTLTNEGSADANGVYIRNIIPEGFEHPRGNDLEYEVGVLRRGQSLNVDLTLMAVEPGQFQNRAVLGAEGDISIEEAQSVSILESRLTVRREGPANRFVGRPARFTNTITNESHSVLEGVTVVETVPAGMQFEGASDGGHFDRQRGTVTWQLQSLDAGAQRQMQVSLIPTQAADFESNVRAFDDRGASTEVNSHLIAAGFSSLKVDVAHDGAPVPIGEEVALRLTIKNRGTAAASQVKTLVAIPPEMRFVNADGPVKFRLVGDNLIEFETLNTLEIDGEEHFDIVLAANQRGDARVRVELQAAELTRPLNQEELVVIHANQ